MQPSSARNAVNDTGYADHNESAVYGLDPDIKKRSTPLPVSDLKCNPPCEPEGLRGCSRLNFRQACDAGSKISGGGWSKFPHEALPVHREQAATVRATSLVCGRETQSRARLGPWSSMPAVAAATILVAQTRSIGSTGMPTPNVETKLQ